MQGCHQAAINQMKSDCGGTGRVQGWQKLADLAAKHLKQIPKAISCVLRLEKSIQWQHVNDKVNLLHEAGYSERCYFSGRAVINYIKKEEKEGYVRSVIGRAIKKKSEGLKYYPRCKGNCLRADLAADLSGIRTCCPRDCSFLISPSAAKQIWMEGRKRVEN